jgi:hypothetical protein
MLDRLQVNKLIKNKETKKSRDHCDRCLSVWGPEPHIPLYTVFIYTVYLFTQEGGGEELNQGVG